MNDFVNVPHERTEAMRLVPDRVLTETLYWMARAYERVHSMPRVSDTELANKIEAAKADLGRARDASPILSNSAAPAPEGGAVSERLAEIATWTDEEWETVFAHRPDLRDRLRAALAAREEAPAEAGELSIWTDARNVFVRYAELFAMTERYEEASAIADKAAREIEAIALRAQPPAREDAQPDAGARLAKAMWGVDLVPAANPAPDALRVAVEALTEARSELEAYEQQLTGETYNNLKLNTALAALQAEQKGGA